ncbi:MAG: TraR/DksA C4-type zinc finger protein [Acidimicrobiales bacterium]
MHRGAYGACARCGAPIPPERLAAQPTSLTCVACARAGAAATSSRVRRT